MKNLFTTPVSSFHISSGFLLRAPVENLKNTPEKDLASTKELANLKIEIADLKIADQLKTMVGKAINNNKFDKRTDVTPESYDEIKNILRDHGVSVGRYLLDSNGDLNVAVEEYSLSGGDKTLLKVQTIRIKEKLDLDQDIKAYQGGGIPGVIGMEIKVDTKDKKYDLNFKGANGIEKKENLAMINTLIENNFANLKTEQVVDMVKKDPLEKKAK